jgi:hypothetical protein
MGKRIKAKTTAAIHRIISSLLSGNPDSSVISPYPARPGFSGCAAGGFTSLGLAGGGISRFSAGSVIDRDWSPGVGEDSFFFDSQPARTKAKAKADKMAALHRFVCIGCPSFSLLKIFFTNGRFCKP